MVVLLVNSFGGLIMASIALAHRRETTRCARSSDAPHGVFPWACLYIQQVRTIFRNITINKLIKSFSSN